MLSMLIALLLVCHYHGAEPDKTCTPGKADPAVTQANIHRTICVHGYTATVRNVTSATKRKVLALYGITCPRGGCGKLYEIDHDISLELGGSNDAENLSPELYKPVPGAHQKDIVENYLHHEVCAGTITLAEAQREITTDWMAVYKGLNSKQRVKAAMSR